MWHSALIGPRGRACIAVGVRSFDQPPANTLAPHGTYLLSFENFVFIRAPNQVNQMSELALARRYKWCLKISAGCARLFYVSDHGISTYVRVVRHFAPCLAKCK
jgi:hypothetical protein